MISPCLNSQSLKAQPTKAAEAAADLSLIISAPKTEYMTVNCLTVSLYYAMAVNHWWSPRIWKTKSTPLLPHDTELFWISALTMFWTPPFIPWLTLCLWFTWLGTASCNFLVTCFECQRRSLPGNMLCTFQALAKGDLVD